MTMIPSAAFAGSCAAGSSEDPPPFEDTFDFDLAAAAAAQIGLPAAAAGAFLPIRRRDTLLSLLSAGYANAVVPIGIADPPQVSSSRAATASGPRSNFTTSTASSEYRDLVARTIDAALRELEEGDDFGGYDNFDLAHVGAAGFGAARTATTPTSPSAGTGRRDGPGGHTRSVDDEGGGGGAAPPSAPKQ